jgi:cyclopropane fatty-acyl-phospholipid synthase-like methyltransferase
MSFYDEEETARQYIDMAAGYDGRSLVEVLQKQLPENSRVLELGMGPGVDLQMLGQTFELTGSDNSRYFLDRYRIANPDADLLYLDAAELDTERTFDCIYSNKVLHHLENGDLERSLRRQKAILSASGIVLHSFWRGEGVEEHHGLKFVYRTEESIRDMFGAVFKIIDIVVYQEMEPDDSLYVLATV